MGDKEFDELLERALEGYACSEPLAGLAERVMVRVRQKDEQRGAMMWMFVAAVALPLILLVVWPRRDVPSPRSEAHLQVATLQAARRTSSVVVAIRRRLPMKRKARPGLTPEELALAQFARQEPEKALQALASLREYVSHEITAKPIEIKAIELEELR